MANDAGSHGSWIEFGDNDLPGTSLIEVTTKRYVQENNVIPKSSKRWEIAFVHNSSRLYNNNFEISSVPFFLQEDVQNFTNYIVKSAGVYKYRWGDAPIRYVTLSIFANDSQMMYKSDQNIAYCHAFECETYVVKPSRVRAK